MKKIKEFARDIKSHFTLTKCAGFKGFDGFCVILDTFHCKMKFHTKPKEYFELDFQNKSDRVRRYYLNAYWRYTQYGRVKTTGKGYYKKSVQYNTFKDMLGRDFLVIEETSLEDFLLFVKRQDRVLFKPNFGSCGRGIFTARYSDGEDTLTEIYDKLIFESINANNPRHRGTICEGFIVQHPELARLYPDSVNTVRVLTLNNGREVKLIAATLRMGNGENVFDNLSAGGIGASVDLETGVLYTFGMDFDKNRYVCHPETGTQIIGFRVPHWEKLVSLIKEAGTRIPEFAVVGWDIAITEQEPVFIEFNGSSGTNIVQFFDQIPKGKEIMEYIKKHGKKGRNATKNPLRKY